MVDSPTHEVSLTMVKKFLESQDHDIENGLEKEAEMVRSKLMPECHGQWLDKENELSLRPELEPLAGGQMCEGQSSSRRGSIASTVTTGSYTSTVSESEKSWSELGASGRFNRVVFKWIGKGVCLLGLLYVFICSLDLLSSAFRILGGKTAGGVFNNSELLQNPITGLMIGILATVLVQSSSTSTSIIVTMVASGIMEVKLAIPMIMGANIGTSVTNTLVSMTQCSNPREFKRAFSGATVHDMFNWLTVIILLPIEWATGYLFLMTEAITQKMNVDTSYKGGKQQLLKALTKPLTSLIVQLLLIWYLFLMTEAITQKMNVDTSYKGGKQQLLKALTKPLTSLIVQVDKKVITKIAEGHEEYMNKSIIKKYCKPKDCPDESKLERCFSLCSIEPFDGYDNAVGIVLLIGSLFILCACLVLMVKLLHSMMKGSIAKMIRKTLNADFPGCFSWLTGYVAILIGAVMTILVQSSSVFTSALTPLVGLGVIKVERMYPLTLGSNIGTTGTGLLAAMAASSDKLQIALQIALCHLFFNISGILIFYPIPFMRRIPIRCAKFLGKVTAKYRWFAIAYMIMMFVCLPGGVFLLSFAGFIPSIIVGTIILSIITFVVILNILQSKCSDCLPKRLRTWEFLPKCLRSLELVDAVIMKCWGGITRCCPCFQRCCETKKTDLMENAAKAGMTEVVVNAKKELKPSPVPSAASSALLLDGTSLRISHSHSYV